MTESAEHQMQMAEPSAEHRWLSRLAGDWSFEVTMAPDTPETRASGAETGRTVGGLWLLLEGEIASPDGAPFRSLMTLGYDPNLDRFVGTFIASMQTHLWIYDTGALDPDGKTLRLECDGPAFDGSGRMDRYMDVIEVVSDDERRLSGHLREADGGWRRFMTTTYRRKG